MKWDFVSEDHGTPPRLIIHLEMPKMLPPTAGITHSQDISSDVEELLESVWEGSSPLAPVLRNGSGEDLRSQRGFTFTYHVAMFHIVSLSQSGKTGPWVFL